jgi:hypothetical protein
MRVTTHPKVDDNDVGVGLWVLNRECGKSATRYRMYRKRQTSFTLIMNTLDEYDILTGFDAMDDDKLGTIAMDQFFTLYLALGYPRLEQHQLEQYVRQTRKNYRQEVTKDMALQVLSQVRVVLFLKASRGNARYKSSKNIDFLTRFLFSFSLSA